MGKKDATGTRSAPVEQYRKQIGEYIYVLCFTKAQILWTLSQVLAPLAKGQRAIVMVLCPSRVRPYLCL